MWVHITPRPHPTVCASPPAGCSRQIPPWLRRGTGGAGRAPTRCVFPLFPRFLRLWEAGGSVLCLFEVRMGNPSQPNRLSVRGGLVPSFFFWRQAVSAAKRGGF